VRRAQTLLGVMGAIMPKTKENLIRRNDRSGAYRPTHQASPLISVTAMTANRTNLVKL
jgi:hypothetical protein